MVSVVDGGGGRNDVGIADNAAGRRTMGGESIQAESSDSSSGHSDKDWIRYSKLRCVRAKGGDCPPSQSRFMLVFVWAFAGDDAQILHQLCSLLTLLASPATHTFHVISCIQLSVCQLCKKA